MRAAVAVAAGALLGVLSRVEETTAGFSTGISSDSAWVAVAFAAGVATRRALPAVAALTAANAAYYGWLAATEPATPLASVAGSPVAWVALGLLAGAVFGTAGAVWAAAREPRRLLAVLPLAAVLVVEGAAAVRAGHGPGGIGLLAGLALPLLSAPALPVRALAATTALAAAAATGAAAQFVP
ncbi:MAG TPA: DUF6518 family protein [Solirubrobacteraceae bacterium]|jgi:hypothetical protein